MTESGFYPLKYTFINTNELYLGEVASNELLMQSFVF